MSENTTPVENVYRLFNHFVTNDRNGNKGKVYSMSVFLVMMQSLGLDADFIYEELAIRRFSYVRSCSHVQSFARDDVPNEFLPWKKWISGIDDRIVLSKKGYICFGALFGIPEKVCVWEFEARKNSQNKVKPINDCFSNPSCSPSVSSSVSPSVSSSMSLPQLPASVLPRLNSSSPQDERCEKEKYLRKK